MRKPMFYEFFAGAGMVRAGLGANWHCGFANDFDNKKCLTYQNNWGVGGELYVGDIRNIKIEMLTDAPELVWGSFPCQDLSLAGGGAGLKGERSGTFYPFWDIMSALNADGRAPKVIALENVTGALTSHGGKDFAAICESFYKLGYSYGALVIDASMFVPQSRPRLFIVGVHKSVSISPSLLSPEPTLPFHTRGLRKALERMDESGSRESWLWWNLPAPPMRTSTFAEIIEDTPNSVEWHTQDETQRLLNSMTPVNRSKVEAAKASGRKMVGSIYKRTRGDENGRNVRAEVRFDDVAGCLRTPAGGSSRQTIIVVDNTSVRSRLISSRETARLMGLPETYRLPKAYNEAYHLTGDGVAVPVVGFISRHLFEPLLGINQDDNATRHLKNTA